MDKKQLVKSIKNYLKEKEFDVSRKSFGSTLCVYERDDLFLLVYIMKSNWSDLYYFRYNYGIKELCGETFDLNNKYMWSNRVQFGISHFDETKYINYNEDDLREILDNIYESLLKPIVEKGLDYICSQKNFMTLTGRTYKPEVWEYLCNYKTEKGIKHSIPWDADRYITCTNISENLTTIIKNKMEIDDIGQIYCWVNAMNDANIVKIKINFISSTLLEKCEKEGIVKKAKSFATKLLKEQKYFQKYNDVIDVILEAHEDGKGLLSFI